MLCPNSSEELDLYGDFFTQNTRMLIFQIRECVNITGWNQCASQAAIDAYFASTFTDGRQMIGQFYVYTTKFNPTNRQATYKDIDT